MQTLTADVAIVGAGPGGLTAAHAVRAAAPHLKVMVFEKSPANLRSAEVRRGAGLGLDVNGQKALAAIKPELHKSMLEMASFLGSNKVLRPDGTEVSDVPQLVGIREHYAKQGYRTPCLFGWSDMQRLLAQTLPDSVPLNLGMEFDHYESDADGEHVTAFFKPSSSSSSTGLPSSTGSTFSRSHAGQPAVAVRAKLLVASDGYFSRVRRQCLNDGPPTWDSTLLWRARLSSKAAAAVGVDLVNSSLYVQDVGRFLFTYPISSGDLVWTVGCHDDKLMGLDIAAIQRQLSAGSLTSRASRGAAAATGVDSSSTSGSDQVDFTQLSTHGYCPQEVAAGQAAKARCLQAMAGVSDAVLRLIGVTPPSSLVEHGVYIRPAASITPDSFGRGRVVVMGDAAHPLRPTGQGYNQTVEDAHRLGLALARGAGSSSADGIDLDSLQAFRAARARRIKPIVAFSTETGRAAYEVLKQAADEEEAARLSMGWGTEEMTNDQFDHYVYDVSFEQLAPRAQPAQQRMV